MTRELLPHSCSFQLPRLPLPLLYWSPFRRMTRDKQPQTSPHAPPLSSPTCSISGRAARPAPSGGRVCPTRGALGWPCRTPSWPSRAGTSAAGRTGWPCPGPSPRSRGPPPSDDVVATRGVRRVRGRGGGDREGHSGAVYTGNWGGHVSRRKMNRER